MFENVSLEAFWAHILAWAWKCLKMFLWNRSGPTFWAGLGNALKCVSGSFLGSHSGLGLEMLENVSPEAFWAYILAWAWKCLKMYLWKRSVQHSSLRLEIFENASMEPF